MTEHEILDEVLVREGGWRDEVERPDGSVDPATNLGITLPTLTHWRGRFGLTTTLDDLRHLSPVVAKYIYTDLFITEPGFTPENVPFEPLRVQLIDFGINSGPARAVRWLQRVLGVTPTGTLYEKSTLDRLRYMTCDMLDGVAVLRPDKARIVNDALVAARSYMIDRSVDTGAMRKADEEGVESRALSFFLAKA